MIRLKLNVVLIVGALALAYGMASSLSADDPKPQYSAILSVKNMCCAKESVPAIKELSKVPGVGRVSVDYKTRSLMIEPAAKGVLSPRAVWEAAERVKIGPVRLATAEGIHTSKPRR